MLLVIALLLGHGSKPNEPDKQPAVEPTATVEEIWNSRCKSCHKAGGEGSKEKKTPDLRDAGWQSKHSDDVIRGVILHGIAETKMRAFQGKMTDAQVDALVAHIRALKK